MGLEGLIFGLFLCGPHMKGFSAGAARATELRCDSIPSGLRASRSRLARAELILRAMPRQFAAATFIRTSTPTRDQG